MAYLEKSMDLGCSPENSFIWRALQPPLMDQTSVRSENVTEGGFLSNDLVGYQRSMAASKQWLVTSDYKAGDVVFHGPDIVHAASTNYSKDGRITLGTEVRFCERAMD